MRIYWQKAPNTPKLNVHTVWEYSHQEALRDISQFAKTCDIESWNLEWLSKHKGHELASWSKRNNIIHVMIVVITFSKYVVAWNWANWMLYWKTETTKLRVRTTEINLLIYYKSIGEIDENDILGATTASVTLPRSSMKEVDGRHTGGEEQRLVKTSQEPLQFCTSCGKKMQYHHRFCGFCGTKKAQID